MKFSIGSKLWTGFISILFVLMVVGGISYTNTAKLTDTARWVNHTYKVLTKLRELLSTLHHHRRGTLSGTLSSGHTQYRQADHGT
ncbi:MAG: CHASE3 domain-containing protein [Methylobacter sp.]